MPAAPELSVILPVLNEAGALPRLLEQLARQSGVALEVIVADGGSSDGSPERARAAGARVVPTPRGRAIQMNAGAAAARGEYLLFLHADSGLPEPGLLQAALAALRGEIAARGPRAAGHFPLRFARETPGRDFFYRYMEEKTATNRRETIHGDQGVLLRADYFRELGGFDERLPVLEDQRFAARVFDSGRWIALPGHLLTSARRFETQGHLRLYTLMSILMGMHAAGVDEFFRLAPKVYSVQGQASALPLGPYLAVVQRLWLAGGWSGAYAMSFNVGRYTRRQSWHLFFWWDVLLRPWLGPGRYPFLRFHDRVFHPLTDWWYADAVTAVGVSVWFLALLPIACAILDRRLAASGAGSGRGYPSS